MMLDELRLGDVSPEESSLGDKMSYEQLLGKNDDRWTVILWHVTRGTDDVSPEELSLGDMMLYEQSLGKIMIYELSFYDISSKKL